MLLHGVASAGGPLKKKQWTPLFNGKDLKGWKQLGGTAKYHVENNEIVGTTVLQTPNSFLATEKIMAILYWNWNLSWIRNSIPAFSSGARAGLITRTAVCLATRWK